MSGCAGHRTVLALISFLVLAAGLPDASEAGPWRLVLADSVTVPVGPVRLGAVVCGPVPAAAEKLVVLPAGRPGTLLELDRRLLLRQLMAAGLAEGVRLAGVEVCRIRFSGQTLDQSSLADSLGHALRRWLPPAAAGAPASWCEVDLPVREWVLSGAWRVELVEPKMLVPGRNLVTARLHDSAQTLHMTATVLCHSFGQVARTRVEISPETALAPAHFVWEWQDRCQLDSGLVVDQVSLTGKSVRRRIAAGSLLRRVDLKDTPLVRRGQPVEIVLRRGLVAVTVLGTARQEGLHGQVISVRNEQSGKLVAGRVVAPGVVAWGR